MSDEVEKYRTALRAAMPCTDRWELVPVPAALHRHKSVSSKIVETFYELRMRPHNERGELVPVTALLWANDDEQWEFVLGTRRCVCDTHGDALLGALRTSLGWYNRAGYDTGYLLPGIGQWRCPPGALMDALKVVRARLYMPDATTFMDSDGELFAIFALPTGTLRLQASDFAVVAQWDGEDGSHITSGGTDAAAAVYAAMQGAVKG